MRSFLVCLAVMLGFGALTGCGSKNGDTQPYASAADPLTELAEIYKYRAGEKLPPPKSLKDLEANEAALPNAWPKIQNGDIVVNWGAGFAETQEAANQVLAYEKDTPSNGGTILLRNGKVQKVSPEEFKKLKKAGS